MIDQSVAVHCSRCGGHGELSGAPGPAIGCPEPGCGGRLEVCGRQLPVAEWPWKWFLESCRGGRSN